MKDTSVYKILPFVT